MTEQEIKNYISRYVLPQTNKANENILRKIIFSLVEVNWQEVEQVIMKEHPELQNAEYFNTLILN